MSVSTTLAASIQIRRSRLLGLVTGVAAVAAAITWALTAYAVGGTGQQSVSAPAPVMSSPIQSTGLSSLSAQERRYLKKMTAVCSVVMCQPDAKLAARLGFGIQSVRVPTRSNVLPSLSPQEQRYLKKMTAVCSVVMCQPDARLAARLGFGSRK